MNKTRRIGSLILVCFAALAGGCASNSGVVPMGDNTFMVTRQAATGFSGSGSLKAEALQEASKFCAAQGKQLKIVAITEAQPPYILANFPKAEVVFKALDAGDPELKIESVVDPTGSRLKVGERPTARSAVEITERQVAAGDVYTELSKLDELHKKGVLTDDEFNAEKKKILNRSK
jgi:Short C-terminal domain